jgi:inositol-hexakisphosphate/diphosphoinositol-pentakisphosphate 1-kinase
MAWRYVQKHKPFLINNLEKQQLLWDRTVIYEILQKIKVPVAKHYIVHRDQNHVNKI